MKITKLTALTLSLLLALTMFTGCSSNEEPAEETAAPQETIVPEETGTAPLTFSSEYFVGKKIALIGEPGTVYVVTLEENVPGAELMLFDTEQEAIDSLLNGHTDAFFADLPVMMLHAARNPGLRILEPYISTNEYGIITALDNDELLEKLNEFILMIQSDGTHDDMSRRWLETADSPPMPEIAEGSGETLRLATSPILDGFTYIRDGEYAGYDIEFAKRFALFMDMKLEIIETSFSGLFDMAISGEADIAACSITITEERKQLVGMTIPYYPGGMVIAVYERP